MDNPYVALWERCPECRPKCLGENPRTLRWHEDEDGRELCWIRDDGRGVPIWVRPCEALALSRCAAMDWLYSLDVELNFCGLDDGGVMCFGDFGEAGLGSDIDSALAAACMAVLDAKEQP